MKPNYFADFIDFTMKDMFASLSSPPYQRGQGGCYFVNRFDIDFGVASIMNGYHLESALLDAKHAAKCQS
jgi:hypothetical protein